ncbi:NAD(+) synthase [Synergistaceae bacterium OttesenSCG-928-D05]|nr:NAD(+) synthase [Synergistaceae bacterium OttesenSCG-928-D05]
MSIYRNPEKICRFIESWLAEKVSASGAGGIVLGISGGIDSAVVAGLASRVCGPENVLGVIMPSHSMPVDEEYARLLPEAFGIRAVKADLSASYDAVKAAIEQSGTTLSPLAAANIKPRLRMATLYAFAQQYGYLVCGGSNRVEFAYGYFTKHGDSGVDLLPLADLLKGEVRLLAEYIGVPRQIIDRPPTAGLWEGQTDEDEMGLSYADLDRYLATGAAEPAVREKIEAGIARSAHKRSPIPMAILPADIRPE